MQTSTKFHIHFMTISGVSKKLLFLSLTILLFTACSNNRYTQNSKEIDIIKAVLNDYDYQNWDTLVMRYADSAKIFHNTRTTI